MTKKKNPNLTKQEALSLAWKTRKEYLGKQFNKGKGSLYNVWRAKVFTEKGKKAGFPNSWKVFKSFIENIPEGFEEGKILIRVDTSLPFSKENCFWGVKSQECLHKCSKLIYKKEEKYLFEWCNEFNLNYNGVKQRYYKGKNYTTEEILFGKKRKSRRIVNDYLDLKTDIKIRTKASKMIAQYKLKDRNKNFEVDDNLTIDYLIEVFQKECTYCGTKEKIGLDRIDNTKGHSLDNVVPCCYRCNAVRSDFFTLEEMKKIGETIKIIENERITK